MKHLCRITLAMGCLSLLLSQGVFAKSYLVHSPSSFSEALSLAVAGDSILIEAGDYKDWSVEIEAEGSESQPITIKPEKAGRVTFSGSSHFVIKGQYIHLEGLRFAEFQMNDRSTIEFEGAKYCQLLHSSFLNAEGNRPVVRFRAGAQYNSLDDCEFINIAGRSVHVQVNETTKEYGVSSHNTIRNNLFRDIPPLGANGRETVKIGQSQPEFGHIKTYTLVENNTFVRANGEGEIISNKSSYNTYRGNTFLDCQGELVMRGGSYCVIENNRFSNCTGGIRLSGTHHTVKNNVILNPQRTGIRLLYGMTREQGGHYQAVSHCLISHNTIAHAGEVGIFIGAGRGRDWQEKGLQNMAPQNNHFEHNLIQAENGDHIRDDQAPDNLILNNLLR